MVRESWVDLPIAVVTPAFLGRFPPGPGEGEAPFPVPSLRGSLAYWLRTLIGAHVGNDIRSLHKVESTVFGAANTRDAGGSSPILLRAERVRYQTFASNDVGVRYLLGPGLNAENSPRCLGAGKVIALRIKNTRQAAHADLFLGALWAMRAFGGIGARTRRGLGTIALAETPSLRTARFDPAWLKRDQVTHELRDQDAVRHY